MLELLMVMGLVLILAALAMPAVGSLLLGSNLNRAGQLVGDQMALARQEAVTSNCDVEVRFFALTSGANPGVRAVQLWRVNEGSGGTQTNPVGRLQMLPEGVVISTNATLSPLLTAGGRSGRIDVPSHGLVEYRGYRIRPSGATDVALTSADSFVTLRPAQAVGEPPANYYTLQLNPVTGKIAIYRP